MDQRQQEPEPGGSDVAQDSPPAMPSPHQPTDLPSPLEQAPTPALQTLCPEVPLCPTILDSSFIYYFFR